MTVFQTTPPICKISDRTYTTLLVWVTDDGTIVTQEVRSAHRSSNPGLGQQYPLVQWSSSSRSHVGGDGKSVGNPVLTELKKLGTPEAIEAIKRIWKRYNLVTASPTFKCKIRGCTSMVKTQGGMCRDCEHDEL